MNILSKIFGKKGHFLIIPISKNYVFKFSEDFYGHYTLMCKKIDGECKGLYDFCKNETNLKLDKPNYFEFSIFILVLLKRRLVSNNYGNADWMVSVSIKTLENVFIHQSSLERDNLDEIEEQLEIKKHDERAKFIQNRLRLYDKIIESYLTAPMNFKNLLNNHLLSLILISPNQHLDNEDFTKVKVVATDIFISLKFSEFIGNRIEALT